MAIDRFTIEEFEAALPHQADGTELFYRHGIVNGEHVYSIPVSDTVGIMIRSTIDETGIAADIGKDSIRLYLVYAGGNPVTKKLDTHTKRTPGWRENMTRKLRTLYKLGKLASKECPCCGKRVFMGVASKKENKDGTPNQNYGKRFIRCLNDKPDCKKVFAWVKLD